MAEAVFLGFYPPFFILSGSPSLGVWPTIREAARCFGGIAGGWREGNGRRKGWAKLSQGTLPLGPSDSDWLNSLQASSARENRFFLFLLVSVTHKLYF